MEEEVNSQIRDNFKRKRTSPRKLYIMSLLSHSWSVSWLILIKHSVWSWKYVSFISNTTNNKVQITIQIAYFFGFNYNKISIKDIKICYLGSIWNTIKPQIRVDIPLNKVWKFYMKNSKKKQFSVPLYQYHVYREIIL